MQWTPTAPCHCSLSQHPPRLIVLTGGPGAGKTAVLEIARRNFCSHVAVLPEAASIIFGGGFIRRNTRAAQTAAQRAIFHVQRELEQLTLDEAQSAAILCDRGTLDGLAYWPNSEASFWTENQTTREAEFSRYHAVIHLRSPGQLQGYNHQNPVRTETADEAATVDERIARVWDGHPNRHFLESTASFFSKATRAIELIRAELPECCK